MNFNGESIGLAWIIRCLLVILVIIVGYFARGAFDRVKELEKKIGEIQVTMARLDTKIRSFEREHDDGHQNPTRRPSR